MKKLIIILILIGSGYYVYQSPYLARFLSPQIKHAIDRVNPKLSKTLYKWRDAKGQWQITDTPPTGGIPYETLNYHKDANVIPSEHFTQSPK